MIRRSLIAAALAGSALVAAPAFAISYVQVTDASQLSYSTEPSGKVWLRNLNVFNSNALGCCWNYSIDPSTPEGKNIWVLLLMAMAQGSSINLGVPDGYVAGAVTYAWK